MSTSSDELAAVGIDLGAQKPAVARALECIGSRYRGAADGTGDRGGERLQQTGSAGSVPAGLGHAPSAVVRVLRLHRARAVILANPYQPVGTAAAAGGISHFGRFSGYYRGQYGETPSETAYAARAQLPA